MSSSSWLLATIILTVTAAIKHLLNRRLRLKELVRKLLCPHRISCRDYHASKYQRLVIMWVPTPVAVLVALAAAIAVVVAAATPTTSWNMEERQDVDVLTVVVWCWLLVVDIVLVIKYHHHHHDRLLDYTARQNRYCKHLQEKGPWILQRPANVARIKNNGFQMYIALM